MSETTALDEAFAVMEAGGDDERLAWYGVLANQLLLLLLEGEPEGEDVSPKIARVEGAPYVLAFDSEEKLAEFAEGMAESATLPGRVLVGMLAGQGLGLAVNLGAASAQLLPQEAVNWFAATLSEEAVEAEGVRPGVLTPPRHVPDGLVAALEGKLEGLAGLAQSAWLAEAERGRLVLAFLAAAPGAERALAGAMREALAFSGAEVELDVAFLSGRDGLSAAAMANGVELTMTAPPEPERPAKPLPPGMDPSKPPKLR
ncbi:SseB family protein [Pseudoroseicyclus tamaricis]|uniref:SseB family protein n=1 Tax=Pseudoroseicyclus tamaricis TaxID=2705421 RepID=A0A6B2JWB8_9RHOB|nr:SseB family protein [Pseudoroseicyclus tamaricis]NDV02205.1 SseB family protein [Pseudoroseicyclus tamaricis]